jgi:hypothetical protein
MEENIQAGIRQLAVLYSLRFPYRDGCRNHQLLA